MRQPGTRPVIVENGTSVSFSSTVNGRLARPSGSPANDNRRPLEATLRRGAKQLWRILPPLVGACVLIYAMSQ